MQDFRENPPARVDLSYVALMTLQKLGCMPKGLYLSERRRNQRCQLPSPRATQTLLKQSAAIAAPFWHGAQPSYQLGKRVVSGAQTDESSNRHVS